jgi:hypothetical protein
MAKSGGHPAEGGKSFGPGQNPPAEGNEARYVGANPNPDDTYDLPLNPGENKFPRESGSDSYSGIPGDGIVGN